jgi:hypothetical protein
MKETLLETAKLFSVQQDCLLLDTGETIRLTSPIVFSVYREIFLRRKGAKKKHFRHYIVIEKLPTELDFGQHKAKFPDFIAEWFNTFTGCGEV